MVQVIAFILSLLVTLINSPAQDVKVIAPSVNVIDEQEWSAFHADAYEEYEDAFTALFNSYETKRSKNNRLMIRTGNSGSYRFVKGAKCN